MDDLIARFGSAKHPEREVDRERPDAVPDSTVAALGKLSEALEAAECARGLLYQFHRMSGTADRTLGDAVAALRQAGHDKTARMVDDVLVGRDVLDGLWTFQIVERYDDQYWRVFRAVEESVRNELAAGRRHVFEAEMKFDEQS